MALLLCGCATSADRLPAPLRVDLSALETCERLLKTVPLPAATEDDDARSAFVRDEAALITANERLDKGRGCVASVRQRYGDRPAP